MSRAPAPRCVICDRGPQEVALIRLPGVSQAWACADHLDQTDAKVAPELRRIAAELKGD